MTPQVIAVVGPTASGKTGLAIALAEALETEIISADSMQIYRGMAIGTDAPTPAQLARVRHHFVGFLDPSEAMSAGRFEELARPVVDRLNAEGKVAVVVGGSGLYIRALIDGLFRGPSASEEVRGRLAQRAETEGIDALYRELSTVDTAYAETIGQQDLRRIVRALEVYELTGKPFSELHADQPRESGGLVAQQVAIDWPRETLYQRIDARVEAMMEAGFVEEVKHLLEQGHEAELERLRTIGYREIAAYLKGEHELEHAVEQMKQQTRRYAKRQLTWFRADDRIEWITPDECKSFVFRMKQRFVMNRVPPSNSV